MFKLSKYFENKVRPFFENFMNDLSIQKARDAEEERKRRILENPKYFISIEKAALDFQVEQKEASRKLQLEKENLMDLALIESERKVAQLSQLQASNKKAREMIKLNLKSLRNFESCEINPECCGVSSAQNFSKINYEEKGILAKRRFELKNWLDILSKEKLEAETKYQSLVISQNKKNEEEFKISNSLHLQTEKQKILESKAIQNFNLHLAENRKKNILKEKQISIEAKLNEISTASKSDFLNEKKSSIEYDIANTKFIDFKGLSKDANLRVSGILKKQINEHSVDRINCRAMELKEAWQLESENHTYKNLIRQSKDGKVDNLVKIKKNNQFSSQNRTRIEKVSKNVDNFFEKSFMKSSR
eukprot:NODE_27_length_39007_cov_1.590650.p12 type:complete len:361 gc:universal NODE_27_length_39007_cov_1.590650:10196-11278(+)